MGFAALALVGGAVAVGGTIKSMKAQKKAAAAQQRQQDSATRRERMQAIREMQVKRAQALVSAQGAGAEGSSGAIGGIGSLGSQLGSNMGFGTHMSQLSNQITKFNSDAQKWGSIAQLGGEVFSYGMSMKPQG